MFVTRFAPSPTGFLHLGHAASARFAFEAAQGGRFLLRIEDIDPMRCREEYVAAIFEDLRWLGLTWEEPVRRQSEHLGLYAKALEKLREEGLLYPCFCTRKEIELEAAASASAPHAQGPVYGGACRDLSAQDRAAREREGRKPVWRLAMARACAKAGRLRWHDRARGWLEAQPERFGDVVLARRDAPSSYHLSVTVDDALQGVTLVTRGQDLFGVTDIHVLLQKLLDLPTPDYHHHPLLLDENGKRFAKRDRAATIRAAREQGEAPSAFLAGAIRLLKS